MSYWDDKWAKAGDNWEEKAALHDSSEEILAGLKRSPGGMGRAVPKARRELLDSGFNVGRSITLTSRAVNLEDISVPLVEVKGDDEEATSIALTLQTEILSSEGLEDKFALLEWGSGGFQASAEVDILEGTVVNLTCSWLRVTAGMAGEDGDSVKFGAFVSYGSRGSSRQPQRTIYRDEDGVFLQSVVPAGVSPTIEIPRFANSVMMVSQVPGAAVDMADYSLRFRGDDGSTVHEALFTSATGSNPGYKSGIPIPWAAKSTRLQIVNKDGADSILFPKLIFGLSL